MVKAKKKENECEGYGIAYSEDDDECQVCEDAEECQSATVAAEGETSETPPEDEDATKAPSEFKTVPILKKYLKDLSKGELKDYINEHELECEVEKAMDQDDIIEEICVERFPPKTTGKKAAGGKKATIDKKATKKGSAVISLKDLQSRIEEMEERLAGLETRVAGAAEEGAGKVTRKKTSKSDKDEKKAELMKGVPYTVKTIAGLSGRDVKMLASAMEINSFGKARDVVEKLILKSAKNKKKSAAKKK